MSPAGWSGVLRSLCILYPAPCCVWSVCVYACVVCMCGCVLSSLIFSIFPSSSGPQVPPACEEKAATFFRCPAGRGPLAREEFVHSTLVAVGQGEENVTWRI